MSAKYIITNGKTQYWTGRAWSPDKRDAREYLSNKEARQVANAHNWIRYSIELA